MARKNTPAMNKRWNDLERVLGRNLATYCMCAVYNVPFYDPTEIGSESWDEYLMEIEEIQGGFLDGTTDITTAMNGDVPENERWEIQWGIGDEDHPYSERDYRRLDDLFKTYSARLVAMGGYDAQQEDTLRNCCKMRLLADRCLARGTKESVAMCTQLNKAIQTELSSEGLRKVDAVQQAEPKLDTFVSKLEKAGLVEQGRILPLQEVQERLIEIMTAQNVPTSRKYPYTIDAADQMMYMIANNMYRNDDMPELVDMPDDLRFDKNVASEFAPSPNRQEKDTYARMGLVRGFAEPPKPMSEMIPKTEEEQKEIPLAENTTVVEKPMKADEELQKEIMDLFFGGEE